MKNIKSNIQSGAVNTVSFIAAPLHIVLSASANLVAELEGRAIEAIDGTPKGQTIENRFNYTNMKMMQAAIKADEIREKLQAKVDKYKVEAKETIENIKRELKQPDDIAEDSVAFQLAKLRKNREEIQEKPELSAQDKKDINAINRAISAINKAIVPVSAEVAFN